MCEKVSLAPFLRDGKGDYSRAKKSAKEKAKKYETSYEENDIDWKGAKDDKDSFMDENTRLMNDGGPGNLDNFNQIHSPGRNL